MKPWEIHVEHVMQKIQTKRQKTLWIIWTFKNMSIFDPPFVLPFPTINPMVKKRYSLHWKFMWTDRDCIPRAWPYLTVVVWPNTIVFVVITIYCLERSSRKSKALSLLSMKMTTAVTCFYYYYYNEIIQRFVLYCHTKLTIVLKV